MRNQIGKSGAPTEDEAKYLRLARGMRAVAATLIVGGIVIAAITAPSASLSSPDDVVGPADSQATGLPLVNPATDSILAPGQQDPALKRVDGVTDPYG